MSGWIMTYTGRQVSPFRPDPETLNIVDIAHALAHTCRYGGHAKRFYSVAEHCVLLAAAAPPALAFDCLMHDAAEAYLGDVPRPIKRAGKMQAWKDAEWILETAIGKKFGCGLPMTREVADLDSRMILDEWPVLMTPTSDDIGVSGEGLGTTPLCWQPMIARREFLMAYDRLKPPAAPKLAYEKVTP